MLFGANFSSAPPEIREKLSGCMEATTKILEELVFIVKDMEEEQRDVCLSLMLSNAHKILCGFNTFAHELLLEEDSIYEELCVSLKFYRDIEEEEKAIISLGGEPLTYEQRKESYINFRKSLEEG